MKLTASTMLMLDGAYQGPGGLDEDRRGGSPSIAEAREQHR
jgi:hypothetical protein